jgi:heterotetrameric sarcosine oxidase gamma subunit
LLDGRTAERWGIDENSSLLVAAGCSLGSSSALATALEAQGIEATDVSSLYATLQLTGPKARAVLEELFPVDISERALPNRRIVLGPLAHVTVVLARIDHRGLPSFTVLVERDQAEYVWDALLHVGARHELEPVGAAAVVED